LYASQISPLKNKLTNTIDKIYNGYTVVRISYHVVYQLTKTNLQSSEGLGNTLDPEWPKVEVKYHGEKISRPGILVGG